MKICPEFSGGLGIGKNENNFIYRSEGIQANF